jgi:hypothetical protein
LETSRGFTAETQGHIHNYVYKLRDLLEKNRGRVYVQKVGFSQGVFWKIDKT